MQTAIDNALGAIPDSVAAAGEVIVDADPASVVAKASEDADLVVMGSRGYGPVRRVLLGGVASAVLREAACPVIVTARSAIGEDQDPEADQDG